MAPSFSTPTKFMSLTTFLLIITMLVSKSNGNNAEVARPNQSETTMDFYLHDVATGPNATVATVIGLKGKVWSYITFGTIFMVDDPVHLSPSVSSTQVGRAQGLLIASSLDGSNVNVILSVVFNSLEYSGSTIQIQGISRQHENYRELSIVSGTGKFRFAKGIASLETSFYDPSTSRSVIRFTLNLVL